MTVKNLNAVEKQTIGRLYQAKEYSQKSLAGLFGVSERSINRVLHELNLSKTLPRMTAETASIMKLLNQHGLDLTSLKALLEQPEAVKEQPTSQPWRVGEYWSSAYPGKKALMLSIGIEAIKTHASHKSFIRWVAGSNLTSKTVTKEQVIELMSTLTEDEYAPLLSAITTTRVARQYNTNVQTSMLNLQKKAEANAKDTAELRRK